MQFLFNVVLITLIELCAVFWVGGQLWLSFVLSRMEAGKTETSMIAAQAQQRFERRWSLPTLLVLLLANSSALVQLARNGRFDLYWLMSEIVVVIASGVAVFMLLSRWRPKITDDILPSLNLLLGALLFTAFAMSSPTSAVGNSSAFYVVLADWFHSLAAALWVGGLLYLATCYLPVLRKKPLVERVQSLNAVLPRFLPLILAGVIIMAVSGPFLATIYLRSWQSLFSTAYGRVLVVKSGLVALLLIGSAIHAGLLSPRLAREYNKYVYALQGVKFNQATQVKVRETRLARYSARMSRTLFGEALLGAVILLCIGLMHVFAGTLTSSASTPHQQSPATAPAYTTSATTSDNAFAVTLSVNPNHFGINLFTVTVYDKSSGKQDTNVGVTLATTMLDMDMGTNTVKLQPDGKGHFSASGQLAMAGHYEFRVLVRATDGALHEAKILLYTPF